MPTKFSIFIFLAALALASILAAQESPYECDTDTECETEAALRCLIGCEA
jgi:hypothetical protein